ncbi:MAG: hypothetical protein ACI3Y2_01360 [Candidatus Egerieousia sp.]
MKQLLFPRVFRIIGWILFIPSIIVGIMLLCPDSMFEPIWKGGVVLVDATIIGLALGAMFIVCSKEAKEDEMVRSIRQSSLLTAFYIYIAILIIGTILINDFAYLDFMAVNLALFPVIYVITFRTAIYRYNKIEGDEE